MSGIKTKIPDDILNTNMENQIPKVHNIPQSPLLTKAKLFAQMLREDNDRLMNHLKNGGNPDDYSIETLNPDDESHIEMTLVAGMFEGHLDTPELFEEINLPPDAFNKATEDDKQTNE